MQKLTREQFQALYDAGPEAVFSCIERLFEAYEHLAQQVVFLQARVKELEMQLAKNSHNSNKPPSSDGLKKHTKSLRQKSERKVGGQKGHKGQTLKQVANPDRVVASSVENCSTCGQSLKETKVHAYEKRQVFDLPPIALEVTEYQAEIKTCPHCQSTNKASFPKEVGQAVQYGSRIKVRLRRIYLMNQHLLPYERTSEIIADFYGHEISVGTLYNINDACFEALERPVENIKEQIIASQVVHFDETGLRVEKRTQWLHSASTAELTFYMFHQRRGSEAMDKANILPQFTGTAIHDHWKPYLKYLCRHGLCNSHHLRELIFIYEQCEQNWAKKMIDLMLEIKQTVEQAKMRGEKDLDKGQIESFEHDYDGIIAQGLKMNPDRDPQRRKKKRSKAQNLLHRLKEHREATLAFMYDFCVPFDNNLAERDIRMVKVQQKISGCFRKQRGAAIFCRIRSYISTMKKQGHNILNSLQMSLDNKPIMQLGLAE